MAKAAYVNGAVVTFDATTGTIAPTTGLTIDALDISVPIVNSVIDTPQITGMYLISMYLRVITPASGGPSPRSTLGGSSWITVTYTYSNSTQIITATAALDDGTGQTVINNSANLITSILSGSLSLCCQQGTPITINVGYSSQGTAPMHYIAHIKSVFLGALS